MNNIENDTMMKKKKHSQFHSFRNYLHNEGNPVVPENEPHFLKKKIIKIQKKHFNGGSLIFLNKAGVDFNNTHPEGRKYEEPTTTDINESYNQIENFLELLSSEDSRSKVDEDMFEENIYDINKITKITKEFSKEACFDAENIQRIFAHTYLKHTSLFFEEMLHFGNLSYTSDTYSLFTTGLPNVLVVLINSARDLNSKSGCPFFYYGIYKIFGIC